MIRDCVDQVLITELKNTARGALSTYAGELQRTLHGLEQKTISNYQAGRREGSANVAASFDEFLGWRLVQTCTVSNEKIAAMIDGTPTDYTCEPGKCKVKTSMAPQYSLRAGAPV